MPEVSPDHERVGVPVESSTEMPVGSTAVADRDEAIRIRTRARWGYGGFGLGLAVGFAVTAVQLANGAYYILPFRLVWNLIWAPFLGVIMGVGLSRTRRPGPRRRRLPQLRTRALMTVVAYVAILLGMGISTQKLGDDARLYLQKWATADSMGKVFREQKRQSEDDAKLRRANVAELRAGRIPEGLLPIQREFLRSLEEDPKVTAEHRTYRRDLITDGEEATRIRQEHNVEFLGRLEDYHEQLAAKYGRARLRPWLPVEADPPMPK